MSKRATIRDIAMQAGCSKGAVSAVLNGARGNIVIGTELSDRVKAVAVELGYEVNHRARSLSRGKAETIGLLVGRSLKGGQHTGMLGQLIGGVDSHVRAHGHDLLILGPSETETEMERGLSAIRQGRVDALVVPGLSYTQELQSLDVEDLPLVVAVWPEPTHFPHVYLDFDGGHRQALAHLLGLGHREILWSSWGAPGKPIAPIRAGSLHAVAREMGIVVREMYVARPAGLRDRLCEIDAFRNAFADYLQHHELPTAGLVYNELTALGALKALKAHGVRVPEDFSMITYDDIFADLADPPLSVISLNFEGIGRKSAELAIQAGQSSEALAELRSRRELVPTRLVYRASTTPPHARPLDSKGTTQ